MSPNRNVSPDGAPVSRSAGTAEETAAEARRVPKKPVLAVGLVVAAIATIAVVWDLRGNDGSSRAHSTASVSPSLMVDRLPLRATIDRSGLVAVLPNLKPAIDPVLSREIRSGELFLGKDTEESPASGQTYIWSAFSTAYGRRLSVATTRYADPSVAHAYLVKDSQATAKQHPPTGTEGLDTGPAEKIAGLGDEAVAVPLDQRNAVEPEGDRPDRRYNIGGGYFDVRLRNVVIAIDLRGAEYPPAAAKSVVLSGKDLSLADSRRTILPIIQAIKTHLY